MGPTRLGVIGLSATNPNSWAASMIIPPLLKQPLSADYVLKALCTSSEKSGLEAKYKYSDIVGYPVNAYYGESGASDISKDPEVDLVVVAVKAADHRNALMPAIEAGKDFFIEWPAGNGLKETEEIAFAARQKGVKGIVGAQGKNSLVINKVREIIASGQLGRIISTTVVGFIPGEWEMWGPKVKAANFYAVDENKGASMLEIGGGHFLVGFLHALGCTTFSSVSSTTKIAYPTASVVDSAGDETETLVTTNPDQVAFSGILKETGAIASITLRSGMKSLPGRSGFTWIIDGEEGTITLENPNTFISSFEPVLSLNGEVVEVDTTESEMSELSEKGAAGNVARSWANFAKGSGYTTIEEAVQVKKIIDAVIRSAKEGKRIDIG